MTSNEVRQKFLDFFKSKQHLIVPSAPLVLKNDPTLMFVNSGMAPFKDYFLGNAKPTSPRIADSQKCLRVTGKQNDLEDVGHDTYHHTLFEMLGNWSFGDYFKREAISWAWELLTEVYKLPKEKLYVSVFGGDEKENLELDTEAEAIWLEFVPKDRIIYGSKKDNFWEMGDVGPCGGCSEIHIDLRSDAEMALKAGRDEVNNDHPQVIEIWNLVFMQFERRANGSLIALPNKHIDTGMGFERLCRAIEGKNSNYDSDVFQPIIQFVATKAGVKYAENEKTDIALRVVADHIRAITFTIADGQLPASNGAGYVIRRILRRAVRYGYTYLGFTEPFLCQIVALLATQFKDVFPEIINQQEFITNVIHEEEKSFLKTLENGLKRLDNYLSHENTSGNASKIIDGKIAFELYDTFGFPEDLTGLIGRENGFSFDKVGFDAEMKIQKDRSRNQQTQEKDDWQIIEESSESVEFVGYDVLTCDAKILRYRTVKEKNKTFYQIVLDKTPFYAESGGQVGDTGTISFQYQDKNHQLYFSDTKKENDLIVHFSEDKQFTDFIENYKKACLENTENDFSVVANVNAEKRQSSQNNHSATHLLQAALKQVLGNHVAQKGSLVNDEVLRFDFTHFSKVSDEEITKVENIVNQKIRENILLDERRKVPIQKAVEELKATALFGEKYGDFVRVITFDADFSRELCGGTHVKSTGNIGFFKIISEGSVSSGVRRIEAITAQTAENFVSTQISQNEQVKELLKNPKDVRKALESLLEEKHQLQKQIEKYQIIQTQAEKQTLFSKVQQMTINGFEVSFVSAVVEVETADQMKQIAFEMKHQIENEKRSLFLLNVAIIAGKPLISLMISEEFAKANSLHAGNIVKELAKEIKGGGGGQPFYATAGGTDTSGIERVLVRVSEFLK